MMSLKAYPTVKQEQTTTREFRCLAIGLTLALAATIVLSPHPTLAASAAELRRDGRAALEKLYADNPKARVLEASAKGILVFPSVVKAGFMIGALIGDGVLFQGQRAEAFYNIAAVSYGYQAGIQEYSYAMFFMNDAALQYLDQSGGFEIGTGPSVVVVDQGVAGGLSTSTIRDDIYAFIFGQEGLMAGLGLQGSKITKINP